MFVQVVLFLSFCTAVNCFGPPMFNEAVSLKGRTAVITGGNSGLGKETAIKLASLGADTIVLCRNPSKAESAIADIKRISGSNNVRALSLDLNSMASVRKCAEDLKSATNKIDILVNNAGIMSLPNRELTEDGFEKQIGVNHMGHFVLTSGLYELLKKGTNPRVVNVASSAHTLAQFDQNDLMLSKEGAYQPWKAYGNSKLANVLFTKELTRKLKEVEDNKMTVVCLHPGVCRTELGRYFFDPNTLPFPVPPLVISAVNFVGQPLFGKYYDNNRVSATAAAASDEQLASWLWKESERLTGATFNF